MHKAETRFEQIASMYPLIQRFCRLYRRLNPEDLAQEVALRLLRCSGSVPKAPPKNWVRSVVRNAAVDKYRAMKKEDETIDPFVSLNFSGDTAEDGEHKVYLAHEIYLDQEADEEMQEAIEAAFAALPEAQREVLQLHCDGKSYCEIAEITQANIGTVRSRLHYGRSRAQEMLAAYR